MTKALKQDWGEGYKNSYTTLRNESYWLFYDALGDYESELDALKIQVDYLAGEKDNIDGIYGNLARAYLLNDMGKEVGE